MTAAGSRTAWQQVMTAQFDIGAFDGFGAASAWQEGAASAARAVARQCTSGDQLAARNAAISAKRLIGDRIADAVADIKGRRGVDSPCGVG